VSGEQNSYQDQTNQNTSTTWLDDQKPVDLDLDGLVDYAKDMKLIQGNLNHKTGNLDVITSLRAAAWKGAVLPEAACAADVVQANYGELRQYLMYLGTALLNVGMAAQTVADAYASTDGWSAASLDAVEFAFCDPGAQRPTSLPTWVTGKTWLDAYLEAQQAGEGAPGTGGTWTDQGQTAGPGGATTHTAVRSDGTTRTITTFSVPGGGPTIVTTTVTSRDGTVLFQQSEQTTTIRNGTSQTATTVSYDGEGHRTGSQRVTTESTCGEDTITTVRQNAKGQTTSTTVDHTTGVSRERTVTTTDGHGKVVQELHIGRETEGVDGVPDSPTWEAIKEIRGHDYAPG
jgi:hypothetical protein